MSIDSKLSVAGDLIYFFTSSRKLRAVDRHSGNDRWSAAAFSAYSPVAPAVADDMVVFTQPVGEQRVVVAVDAVTGTPKWTTDLKGALPDSQPQIMLINGLVYLIINGPNSATDVYALDQRTGQQLWQSSSATPPVVTPDSIYTVERGSIDRDQVIALDGKTGAKRWSLGQIDAMSLSTAANQVLYSGCLTALDLSNVQVLWKAAFADDARCTNLSLVDDLVLIEVNAEFGRQQPGLYAFDRRTGAVRWRIDVEHHENGAHLSGPPISIGQNLFTVTSMGDVTALDKASGVPLWKSSLEYAAANDDPSFFITTDDQQTLIVGNSHGPDIEGIDLQTGARRWVVHNVVDEPFVKIDKDIYIASQDQLIALSLSGAPPDSSVGLDHASLTITAVAECPPQSNDTCQRQPMDATFVVKQGETVVIPLVEVRVASKPISLAPGTYTIEPTDPVSDPSVSVPEPKTVTLGVGEAVTVPFSFEQR